MARNMVETLMGLLLAVITLGRRAYWFVRRPVTLGARSLVLDGDQVLLVRGHGQDRWHLPGGAVNRNETLAEAARRETREEAGCEVEIECFLGMYFSRWSWKSDHMAIFVARPVSPVVLRFNIEIGEARYFPIAALPRNVDPTVRRRLDDYASGTRGIHGSW